MDSESIQTSTEIPDDTDDSVPNPLIRHVQNIVEYERLFMEQANKFFEDQEANNKLTIRKEENLNEIINTLKRWDTIIKKTALQFKWRKRFYIIIFF